VPNATFNPECEFSTPFIDCDAESPQKVELIDEGLRRVTRLLCALHVRRLQLYREEGWHYSSSMYALPEVAGPQAGPSPEGHWFAGWFQLHLRRR
jgi:hypothetical protein